MTEDIYRLEGRIIKWIDADTIEFHWFALALGDNWRIRLRDRWAVEDEDDPVEHARLLAEAKALLGDEGAVVQLTNYHHKRIFERIEARVDFLRKG